MVEHLDRKIMYWVIILIPCCVALSGLLLFNKLEYLVFYIIIFAAYSYCSLHRCPSCSQFIFSWALRCDKCEKEAECCNKKIK